jgi:DNA-binding IclR family transcriptional regulator
MRNSSKRTKRFLRPHIMKIKRTAKTILTWSELKSALEHLRASMYTISDDEVRLQMQGIIPEYLCPPRKIFAMAARAGAAEAMASGD